MRKSRIPAPETPWLSQTVRYLFFRRPLQVGDRFDIPFLDPLTGRVFPLRVSVEEKELWVRGGLKVPVYRLSYMWDNLRVKCWVNEAGETLKEEGWGGFTLVREGPEEALTRNWADNETPDLIQISSVPVRGAPEKARSLSYLQVRFSGLDWDGLQVEDHRQRRRGDLLEIRREDDPQSRDCTLPLSGLAEASKEMEPTPLIQNDDERIQTLAAQIAGGEREAAVVARRILKWVHDHLNKVPTVSVPSAVEVLQMRQGDCNEHAVLFAALARASGIPTRVVAGLLLHEGRFYYHAWNEVYLCGWYSVDPLLGQMPADAGHVRLVTGGLGNEVRLLPTVGRVRAEVVTYR
jgi:transglutaminase-like putative cysteine protease